MKKQTRKLLIFIVLGILIIPLSLIVFRFHYLESKTIDANSVARIKSTFKKETLHYFAEIAFGAEYNAYDFKLSRWTDPKILIGIYGHSSQSDRSFIERTVAALNDNLSHQHIQISRDENSREHIRIFFLTVDEIRRRYPDEDVAVSGFMDYRKDFFHALKKIDIVINASSVSPIHKKHTVLEELTQSLGLMQDSYTYKHSIFHNEYGADTALAPIDKELIQLLYNYGLPIGLSKERFIEQVLE